MNDARAALEMLGKRVAHMGGDDLAQRQRVAAAQKSQLEEGIKRSLRASEAVSVEIEMLERRLAAKRKGLSPEQIRAAAAHRERVIALAAAQRDLATAKGEERPARRAEVDRLRALIDQTFNANAGVGDSGESKFRVMQELFFLEREIELKREALEKLVAKAKTELDHAQRRYREIDEGLAQTVPFFAADGGDR